MAVRQYIIYIFSLKQVFPFLRSSHYNYQEKFENFSSRLEATSREGQTFCRDAKQNDGTHPRFAGHGFETELQTRHEEGS